VVVALVVKLAALVERLTPVVVEVVRTRLVALALAVQVLSLLNIPPVEVLQSVLVSPHLLPQLATIK